MVPRLMVLSVYLLLVIGARFLARGEQGPAMATSEPIIAVVINDMVSERRIAVSVINVRASNLRLISALDHAENMGDATIYFKRGGVEFRRERRPSNLLINLVDWYPGGQGFTQAKKKEIYVAAFGLSQGCYEMTVLYSNATAANAPSSGSPGPVTSTAESTSRVCFDERDVANALTL